MESSLQVLLITAASIGFFHTLFGPDHYLPFVVMSKARGWSMAKTQWITFLCGLGHVLSSVILGFIGIAFGVAVTRLEIIESHRGELAAWALMIFGFLYMAWGIRKAVRNIPHTHAHFHPGGETHEHRHTHAEEHTHLHSRREVPSMTPWVLFTIFVLGPCEPLIPLLMFPAAQNSMAGVFLVAGVFGLTTITTMMGMVGFAVAGIRILPLKLLERSMHAVAGGTIFACGAAIQFLGL